MSSDPLYNIQVALKAFIGKCTALANVPCEIADTGVLTDQVIRVSSVRGLAIGIEPADTDFSYSGANAMCSLKIAITVTETPAVNRTATGCNLRATEAVATLVKHFRPKNNPPAMLLSCKLVQDSGGRVELVLTGVAKEVLS